MDKLQEIICVDLSSLRFLQSYVREPTVEAKKWIEHLQFKWGKEWRNHRFDLYRIRIIMLLLVPNSLIRQFGKKETQSTKLSIRRDVRQKVIDQLAFLEIGIPIEVEKRGEIYIVQN